MSDQTTCDCKGCTNSCEKAYSPDKLEDWQEEIGDYDLNDHSKKRYVMNRCSDCMADHKSVMNSTAGTDKIREGYYVEVEYEVRTRVQNRYKFGSNGSPVTSNGSPVTSNFSMAIVETTMNTEIKLFPLWHAISGKDIDDSGHIIRDDYYTKSSLGEAAIYIRNPEHEWSRYERTYHINYIKVLEKKVFDF